MKDTATVGVIATQRAARGPCSWPFRAVF